MPQTSYANTYNPAFEGMLADTFESDILSKLNLEASASLAFGEGVRDGAASAGVNKMSAAGQPLLGVVVFEQRETARLDSPAAIAAKECANVLRKGRIWVNAEQAITLNSAVYVRHTAGGAGQTPGRFRKDADGTAQVDTITPTAVNSAQYQVSINGYVYNYTADGSATAAEIVTAMIALVNADTALHGVTASGTTTLILTGGINAAFSAQVGANMALVHTTPYAAKATLVSGARWATLTSGADSLAVLELNLPA